MARSVSYAKGAKWVLYTHVEEPKPEGCDYGDPPHQDDCQIAWDDFMGTLKDELQARFPSLTACDEWLGREDRAVLQNDHAYFGVSEYMGLVSVWAVPKQDDGWGQNMDGLHAHWTGLAEAKAKDAVKAAGELLVKVATFSNGEAVFQRAA